MEYHDIIDEHDHKISVASRVDIYEKLLPHRIVHILIFNQTGEMALQLRDKTLSFCPDHWCSAAGGHVQAGETYRQAALRELQEETGLVLPLKRLFKSVCCTQSGHRRFLTVYQGFFTGPIAAGEDVQKVAYFSLREIAAMINSGGKFHPDFLFILRNLYPELFAS